MRPLIQNPNPFSQATYPDLTVTTSSSKHHDLQQLDELTGGAFTAPTSGERAARVRTWLASSPSADQLAEVFKELSGRDKGAARLLREKLDDIKRSKGQEAIAQEWAAKAQTLLAVPKLNIADALAWQRDAAKAGAPLSKEPLTLLKVQLADRVKIIEDLQHRVQVQREAAVLLAQRIEVLSMKPWRDAQAVWDGLRTDVSHWQDQAMALLADGNWPSVDVKFPPLLDASRAQLLVVWDAFQAALAQAVAASDDAAAPLPPVPQWANELRAARGVAVEAPPKPQRPKIDPEIRAQAETAVRDVLAKLELEIAEGHGKASAGAANALRNALKEHGRLVGDKLEHQAQTALAAAGELEGWQRWRADQLREELVTKAEGLLKREPGHELGGRKMQDSLRTLREQWKQTDQGGVPNHALWKRFDEACNQAYKVVETWLDKVKAESAEHKAQRLTLIEEVKTWAAENPSALDDDWKGFNRILHQFGDRWRDGGHLNEKAFAELQPQWLAAINAAAAPLEALQKLSVELRQAMIEEAKLLGNAPMLRVDAVKTLQQRWQAEAHAVPLERRFEQKLWDAFRKPIDEAFNRKTAEREKADADLNARDRVVLDAAKALEAANAGGDAQQIRGAMAALEAALRGQALAQSEKAVLTPVLEEKIATMPAEQAGAAIKSVANLTAEGSANGAVGAPEAAEAAANTVANASADAAADATEAAPAEAAPPVPAPAPVVPRKPVVAMRGDDRPGMKKSEPAAPGRGGKFGDRKDGPRGDRPDRFGGADRGDRGDRPARPGRFDNPDFVRNDAPRLGDTAFRAQRDALERAQFALKKLAAQAHGESIVQLLTAWEKRDAALLPSLQELGNRANAAARNGWAQALAKPASGDAAVALLRLEMAAEQPTPAEHISARRMLQLQLLTRRNDPPPAQTWAQDAATVLASDFQAEPARRVQNVLKVLLKN
jgi:ATP-dependent RNA helicase SUPV3L1/SUV3